MKKAVLIILAFAMVLAFGCSKNEKAETHDGEMANHEHKMSADSLFTCPMHKEFVTSDASAKCPQCQMALKPVAEVNPDFDKAAVQLHVCPMHPDFVSTDKDGVCPICMAKISEM